LAEDIVREAFAVLRCARRGCLTQALAAVFYLRTPRYLLINCRTGLRRSSARPGADARRHREGPMELGRRRRTAALGGSERRCAMSAITAAARHGSGMCSAALA